MKLISLNTWGGRAGKEKILDFFRKYKDTDVFCLQEVWNGGHDQAAQWGDVVPYLLSDVSEMLRDHVAFFRPHWQDWYGLAILISRNLGVREEGDVFVFRRRADVFDGEVVNHARNIQYVEIETKKGPLTVINFHGLWNGGEKTDTDERLLQSDNIVKFLKRIPHSHILCGDFNLLPQTKSLGKLENLGMRNLVKEFGITSTRSSYYAKPERFADYTLASNDIKVNEFKILPDEVSDHLAMYLNFEN